MSSTILEKSSELSISIDFFEFEIFESIRLVEGSKIQLKECFTRRLKVIQISIV